MLYWVRDSTTIALYLYLRLIENVGHHRSDGTKSRPRLARPSIFANNKNLMYKIASTLSTYRQRLIYKRNILQYSTISCFAGAERATNRKRSRTVTPIDNDHNEDVVVLDDEEDYEANIQDQRQRQRIMQFANNVASRKEVHPSSSDQRKAENYSQVLAGNDTVDTFFADDDDETVARQRIMQHALQINAERGLISGNSNPYAQNNSLLAQLHRERRARQGTDIGSLKSKLDTQKIDHSSTSTPTTISILSYNVWFREDVALVDRVTALIDSIATLCPDVVCFQEMTPTIYNMMKAHAPWWNEYCITPDHIEMMSQTYCTALMWRSSLTTYASTDINTQVYMSLPFENSSMGRDLKIVNLRKNENGLFLRVGTTHLESPTGSRGPELRSAQRIAQCTQSLEALDRLKGDTVLIGDLNWTEKNDGSLPLPQGWIDAWPQLRPLEKGFTYDAVSNAMLGKKYGLRLRLDRALVRLTEQCGWSLSGIELVGTEPIPGKLFNGKAVLPSDHYGLLVTLVEK